MNEYNHEVIYHLFLKDSCTAGVLVDLDDVIICVNDVCNDLFGYTEEDMLNKSDSVFIPNDTQEQEKASMKTLLTSGKTDLQYKSSRIAKNGNVILVQVTAIVFRNETGNIKFIMKRFEDITEQHELEEKELNQRLYLQTILDEMPMNIYFKDRESRFILVSQSNISFLGGKTMDDIRGKTDFDFFQDEHAVEAFEDEKYIIKTGRSIVKEEKEVHKDHTVTYVLTNKSPLRDKNRNIIGTYGISRDITPLKLAEEKTKQVNKELEEKNKKLEDTIEELSRTQNKLIFAEKMAALGNLIGGIAHEINTPLGAIKASSSNIQEVVDKINVDLPWIINNASSEEINWLFKLINEADARDISVFSKEERMKKRELSSLFQEHHIENASTIADTITTLRLNQSNEEYLQLLSMPNSQNLLQMLKVLFSLKRNANNIFVSVEKASNVVRALKNYIYKNSQGEYEATNLVDTIDTVLILTANMIKHTKTEIVTRYGEIPLVFCKQDEMCQVWTNIITNAMQAMGESGKLEIGSEFVGDSSIRVWFKDNGPGIPEHVKPRIFEPYFTTKEQGVGTGMGLDISRQIIENHKGKLYFESEAGKGTTFFVEIPINQEPDKKQTNIN